MNEYWCHCVVFRIFPGRYYMLRELAFMRRASHPNIVALEMVNLHQDRLNLFFE